MKTKAITDCRCRFTLAPIGIFALLLLVGAFLAPAPAEAGTVNGCMVERFNETKPANVTDLNCTSNDVQLALYRLAGAPTSCIDGEYVTEALIGEFVATSAERWDVGAFIAVDGGTPNDLGGSCYSDFLHPVSADNTDLDLLGGFGPFYNGEITEDTGDMCGDIEQGQNAFLQTDVISFPCQDSDGDGKADIQSCTVWANSRSDGGSKPSCIDEGDVTAETTAKCTCDIVNIADLDFLEDATIIVNKAVLFADGTPGAPGLFDLQIDGVDEAMDQGHGGTTGPVIVSAGTSLDPGAIHAVSETAGSDGTLLADYDTSISCDNGQSCSNCITIDVDVDPNDVVTCTITNQLIDPCFNVVCSHLNDQCNVGVCVDGQCFPEPVANSTPCEDGLYCTSFGGVPGDADHCFNGTCTGTPVDCGPGDDCNDNVCNEDLDACEFVPVENSTPCQDGLYCTSFGGVPGDADHCFDGTCTGEPVDCGPGDDCNTNECNEASDACEFVPVENSTPCEDGLYCTSFGGVPGDADHCFDGTCTGEPVDCGDGDDCNTNECNEASDACEFVQVANSTPCEDGLYCTSFGGVPGDADHCFDGTCTGEPVDCGDGDDCNTNECNEASDACEFVPVENSTPCEDGLYCTSFGGVPGDADHCFDGTCTGEPVDCGDGDDCNTNECNEASDACEFVTVENSTPCEDGLYCTSFGGVPGDADHCFDGTCTGEPVDCGDGDDCNTNECNEASDACEFVPVENSTPCEDGLYCTSFGGVPGDADHCFDGTCTGEPVDCGDGDDCNTNECNEASDACEFVPVENSTPCEDGLYCTSFGGVPGDADHCFDGTCTGEPVDCGDGDDCNTNECNEASDACEFVPVENSTPCEDGLYCTSETGTAQTPDHCFGGVCTGVPVDCSEEDDECNVGTCDETDGACFADPKADSTPCEDGDFCTSETGTPQTPDHCFGGVCTGVPVDCSEEDDECNVGTCDETDGACFADPEPKEGDFCGDPSDTVCTDPDTCESGVCVPNNEPCGFVTDSGLCTFDVGDVCGTGDENREFRLVYTPDVKSWPAHKLNASNPGQTYYNLFYEGDPTTLTISIPWPYVSHGAMPLHIYDGDLVGTNGCFYPPEDALDALGVYITLDDWATGGATNLDVTCDMVMSYADSPGYCTFEVEITAEMLSASGQVYVNYHLDYGLKGKDTDANPVGGDPPADRYDLGANATTGGWDALFDTELGNGEIGVPDCNTYDFSHDDGEFDFTDTVASTNEFKRIAGAIGQGLKSNNGQAAKDVEVLLVRNDSGQIVQSGRTDQDGFYALLYKHKGKPAWYSVIARDGECEALLGEYEFGHQIELQGNGWVDVQFDTYYCSSTAEYGSGRNKSKK